MENQGRMPGGEAFFPRFYPIVFLSVRSMQLLTIVSSTLLLSLILDALPDGVYTPRSWAFALAVGFCQGSALICTLRCA